jgi:hypothetical protein
MNGCDALLVHLAGFRIGPSQSEGKEKPRPWGGRGWGRIGSGNYTAVVPAVSATHSVNRELIRRGPCVLRVSLPVPLPSAGRNPEVAEFRQNPAWCLSNTNAPGFSSLLRRHRQD